MVAYALCAERSNSDILCSRVLLSYLYMFASLALDSLGFRSATMWYSYCAHDMFVNTTFPITGAEGGRAGRSPGH